jgi:hypothetical protein
VNRFNTDKLFAAYLLNCGTVGAVVGYNHIDTEYLSGKIMGVYLGILAGVIIGFFLAGIAMLIRLILSPSNKAQ